ALASRKAARPVKWVEDRLEHLLAASCATERISNFAAAPFRNVVRVRASSGTTGTLSFVGLTRHDKQRWTECIARSYWSQGLRPDGVFAMNLSLGFLVGGLPVAGAVEEIDATLLPVGTGASDRLIASIQAMHATVLATAPSYAIYLAEIARPDLGVDPTSLEIRNVMVGAEPGGGVPEIRARIESEWDATCTESIGNANVITIGSAECEAKDGCHFMMPDYLLMEIIDPDTGSIIAADQPELEGEMLFMHLDRACNPMLRFGSRDHVVMKTNACPCGRTGPRLKCVGRTDDMLILRGVNVWPSAIKDVVMSFRPEDFGETAISPNAPGPTITPPLQIKVEQNHGDVGDDALASRIESKLSAKLIFTAKTELIPPDILPRTEMKAKLIEIKHL
ncbi:MAG: phenylacetate--CoA ligase family protein, partial [Alphaproteobacteria bacterium]